MKKTAEERIREEARILAKNHFCDSEDLCGHVDDIAAALSAERARAIKDCAVEAIKRSGYGSADGFYSKPLKDFGDHLARAAEEAEK